MATPCLLLFARAPEALRVKTRLEPSVGTAGAAALYRAFLEDAARSFAQRFQLADHVEVKGADLKDGLLHIDLVRNVPERLKPRTIAIGNSRPAQVEAVAA